MFAGRSFPQIWASIRPFNGLHTALDAAKVPLFTCSFTYSLPGVCPYGTANGLNISSGSSFGRTIHSHSLT